MSYILDALKKSEQQRGHGAIPDVQTVHSSSLSYRDEKKAYWPYLLITAVLLNLIAIIYFIIDKDKVSESHTVAIQNTVIENNTPIAAPAEEKKQTEIATGITNNTKLKETMVATKDATQNAIRVQPSTSPVAINEKTISTINKDTVKPGQNSNTVENKKPAQSQTSVIEFYDLPDSIQRQLPAIVISAHFYSSNPLQRSIVINNNFLEEGQYVIDNLILSEITTDGAIFDYQGTLFRYGVVSGWQ